MAAMPERRIAVCLDDFGLHEGVNDAALALADLGRLTAISCMVGAPAWRSGAPSLARLDPQHIDVGLHLDLTQHPLAPASHRPLPVLVALSAARLIERRRLLAEINAQLDAFEQEMGRPPAHVDGHQHVHQFPVIRELLIEAALNARHEADRHEHRGQNQRDRDDRAGHFPHRGQGRLAWAHAFLDVSLHRFDDDDRIVDDQADREHEPEQ